LGVCELNGTVVMLSHTAYWLAFKNNDKPVNLM
jgi:hypothetical protein